MTSAFGHESPPTTSEFGQTPTVLAKTGGHPQRPKRTRDQGQSCTVTSTHRTEVFPSPSSPQAVAHQRRSKLLQTRFDRPLPLTVTTPHSPTISAANPPGGDSTTKNQSLLPCADNSHLVTNVRLSAYGSFILPSKTPAAQTRGACGAAPELAAYGADKQRYAAPTGGACGAAPDLSGVIHEHAKREVMRRNAGADWRSVARLAPLTNAQRAQLRKGRARTRDRLKRKYWDAFCRDFDHAEVVIEKTPMGARGGPPEHAAQMQKPADSPVRKKKSKSKLLW